MPQYIQPPFDPTALTAMTFAQLYQLVSGLTPAAGTGFTVVTTDVASVPQVPDATTYPELQRFLWVRVQISAAVCYVWSPGSASDPTLQKWQPITQASIPAGSVTTAMLQNLCVTDDKINDVNWSKITGIPTVILGTTQIPGGDLAWNATTNPSSTYSNPVIAPLAITTGKIALLAITNALLAINAVATNNVQDLAITDTKLANNQDWSGKTIIFPSNVTITQPTFNTLLAGATFTVDNIAIANGLIGNTAHGLSSTPKTIWTFKCTVGTAGYAVGDEIGVHSVFATGYVPQIVDGHNSTNVWLTIASTVGLFFYSKTGGITSFNTSDWVAKCVAQL